MPNNVAPGRDAARHVATPYDPLRHTLTVRDVEAQLLAAGVPRSRRHVQRLCENKSLDATPLGPNDEWYVSPDSVPKVIGDLRALDEARARRVATQRDVTQPVAPAAEPNSDNDMSRHDATQRDMSDAENKEKETATPSDTSRRVATDLDIFEHPYVKKLEDRLEKVEAKYEAQVRRTEEIQMQSQEKLLELQRMTTIGQSKTLADFMRDAKEWIVGGANKTIENREVTETTTP